MRYLTLILLSTLLFTSLCADEFSKHILITKTSKKSNLKIIAHHENFAELFLHKQMSSKEARWQGVGSFFNPDIEKLAVYKEFDKIYKNLIK